VAARSQSCFCALEIESSVGLHTNGKVLVSEWFTIIVRLFPVIVVTLKVVCCFEEVNLSALIEYCLRIRNPVPVHPFALFVTISAIFVVLV
jgi:hypothetical protein